MNEGINERVAKHDVQIVGLEKRMKNVEADNRTLTRLTTLLEEQMKVGNDRERRQSEVLEKINENLTGLNSRFDNMENRVGHLESSRIDFNKLWKDVVFKVVPGIILAWLVYHYGIK